MDKSFDLVAQLKLGISNFKNYACWENIFEVGEKIRSEIWLRTVLVPNSEKFSESVEYKKDKDTKAKYLVPQEIVRITV